MNDTANDTERSEATLVRILVVGSGGVGDAVARIAARRRFFERLVVADVDLGRAQRTVEAASAHDVVGGRFAAAVVDASSADAVEALVREHGATHVLNAVDPRFVLPIFEGVRAAGARLPRHGDVPLARRTPSAPTSCPA